MCPSSVSIYGLSYSDVSLNLWNVLNTLRALKKSTACFSDLQFTSFNGNANRSKCVCASDTITYLVVNFSSVLYLMLFPLESFVIHSLIRYIRCRPFSEIFSYLFTRYRLRIIPLSHSL